MDNQGDKRNKVRDRQTYRHADRQTIDRHMHIC